MRRHIGCDATGASADIQGCDKRWVVCNTHALRTIGIATVATLTLAATPAYAQRLLDQYLATDVYGIDVQPGVTVLSRERPEYDAPGIRLGEITIRPQLLESVGFDDNVLGQQNHRSSAVVETNAQVNAIYDHSDTKAYGGLTVDDNRFPQQSQQSFTNWTASLGVTHQMGQDTLTASYDHLNLNQTVRDLDVPLLDNALSYRVDTAQVAYHAVLNRVFIEPGVSVSAYSFTDGSVGGVPYAQKYRDRVVVVPNVTVGYELSPRRNLVAVVRDSIASYTNHTPGTINRNFNDLTVLGGLDFEASPLWRYRLLVGYETRTFDSAQVKTIQAPVAEAKVIWNPNGLTTVTGTITRHIQDSADESTSGFTETAFGMQVDRELRRNVLLRLSGSYLRDDYSQNQGSQELVTGGPGVTWLINRTMRMTARYDFTRRISNGSANLGILNQSRQFGTSYSENTLLLQLRLAL